MGGEYYKTKESVDEYIRLSEGYNGAQLIEKLKDFLPLNSHLLEIGSGPGTDCKMLSVYFHVTGSDNSSEFLNRLIEKNPDSKFLELDAITLDTNKKFNGIYSNKVLHHLTDEEIEASIKRQYEILSPEGIICHSFWKGEGSETFNGLFVNYHSDKSIRRLLADYFEILFIESYLEFEKGDSVLVIGKKKQVE